MRTPAERKADERQRRKDAGEVQMWIPAAIANAVRDMIAGEKQDAVT